MTDKTGFVERIVGWLRAGYPDGLPTNDYIALVALLGSRLTPEQVEWVVSEVMKEHPPAEPIDVKVLLTKTMDRLPSESDVTRVKVRLAEAGWPLAGFED